MLLRTVLFTIAYLAMYFSGLEYQLSVELLRKSADKILAHFFRNSNSSPEYLVSSITAHEIDALEYLGGYVLHHIEKKLVRKKNANSLAIFECFQK